MPLFVLLTAVILVSLSIWSRLKARRGGYDHWATRSSRLVYGDPGYEAWGHQMANAQMSRAEKTRGMRDIVYYPHAPDGDDAVALWQDDYLRFLGREGYVRFRRPLPWFNPGVFGFWVLNASIVLLGVTEWLGTGSAPAAFGAGLCAANLLHFSTR
ncbi:MAG: hypothetical protein H6834_14470 [Planctomycetes bacterium]|nr:hypothetical protein [Planctomycetota bacterium]MCB9891912.1 hypothetical protein [Planctomycetota bacterium]